MNKPPPPLRILVVGPANSGKSTFVGHFLLRYGCLEPEMMKKLWKQKEEEGMPFGQLLASLRVLESEASSGRRYYKSPRFEVCIVNPPNRATNLGSFFPNGEQAACVMLLVSAAEGEFEADWRLIQSQVCFACSLPLQHLAFLVNKMDSTQPPYSKERYEDIAEKIHKCFKLIRRGPQSVVFSPISAIGAGNLQIPWFQRQEVMSRGAPGIKTTLLDFLDSISICKPQEEPTGTHSGADRDAERGGLAALDLRVSHPSAQTLDLAKHPGPSSGSREDHPELPLTRQERRPGQEAAWWAEGQQWARKGEASGAGRGARPEKRHFGLVQADAGLPRPVSQPAPSLARPSPSYLLPSRAALYGLWAAHVQPGSPWPEGPPHPLVREQGALEPSRSTQLAFLQPPEQQQQRRHHPGLSPFSSAPAWAQPLPVVSQPPASVWPRGQLGQNQAWPFPGSASPAAAGRFPSPMWVVEGPSGSGASPRPLLPAAWLLPAPPAQGVPQAPEPRTPPRSPPPAAS